MTQNKMITDSVVTQLNESIREIKFELQDMRDKVNELTHRSSCVVEIERVKEASISRVSELERERNQKASKLAVIEQHRDELLESNQSLENSCRYYALELAKEQAARYRLQEEQKAITQEFSQYRAETQPLIKKEEARKSQLEQKRRGMEMMEAGAKLWMGLATDTYKIKRVKP
jgi:chromosome segregation ATPase